MRAELPGSVGQSPHRLPAARPGPDATVTQAGPRRRLLTVPSVTGIAFTLSWIAGLAIPAPSPKLTASGAGIAAAFAAHQAGVAAQFTLTEGLPAAGLMIISIAPARAARKSGAVTAARFAGIAGVTAAVISLAQFALGLVLARATAPSAAHLLIYCGWRIGEQITAGLDPNWTVNAWGGPSYFGAMACHYLDMGLLMAAAAWLLGKILLPDPASTAHRGTPAPTASRPAAHHADVLPPAHRN